MHKVIGAHAYSALLPWSVRACQLSSNFESQQYFWDKWTLILDSSLASHHQFTTLQCTPICIQALPFNSDISRSPLGLCLSCCWWWSIATLLLSLDLSAAFDTIDHSILLKRLSGSFGVMGSAHNWLNSYLSGRSNSVRVRSSSSHVISSICGVRQGSVLFPIYISPIAHIASLFNVRQQQYADDTQLMLFISPSNIENSLLNL